MTRTLMTQTPRRKQHQRVRDAYVGLTLVGSWGFLGFGVLEAPILYCLTIVLPGAYLASERFATDNAGRDLFWWQVFGGMTVFLGIIAYRLVGALLYAGG